MSKSFLPGSYILIIAASGRMLAQSAIRAGLRPLVIDLFRDQDTLALSSACLRVQALTLAELLPQIRNLQKRYPVSEAVYGGGLEREDRILDMLQEKFLLHGNTPDTFRRVLDKDCFFRVLTRLHIDFPEVTWSRPADPPGWLIKPCRGQGGMEIRFSTTVPEQEETDRGCYWQRWIDGQAMSALFLADRTRAALIGFNTQRSVHLDSRQRFVFSGLINRVVLPGRARKKITDCLERLVPALSLTGLNSLDFIWDGQQIRVLEINPRPSASMLLYDADYPRGLLWEHLRSDVPGLPNIAAPPRGWQILYAPAEQRIPVALQWPQWAADRAGGGSLIRTHQPICSIIASGNCPGEVFDKLRSRKKIMIDTLRKGR